MIIIHRKVGITAWNSTRLGNEETRWDKTEERLKMTQIISPANQLLRGTLVPFRRTVGTEKRINLFLDPMSLK